MSSKEDQVTCPVKCKKFVIRAYVEWLISQNKNVKDILKFQLQIIKLTQKLYTRHKMLMVRDGR